MDGILLDAFAFEPDAPHLMKKMHLKEGRPETDAFTALVDEAREAARPRVYYKVRGIQSRGVDHIVIDGAVLKSRVLRVNTDGLNRVFPFVATCGEEMVRWADGYTDMLSRYYADELKLAALRAAMRELEKDIERRFDAGPIAQMQPGSLEDWPIYEQKPLFEILGDANEAVGVRLNSSLVMIPDKSESGIYFQNDKGYVNCKLCPVKKCPSRRAKYDKGLIETFY